MWKSITGCLVNDILIVMSSTTSVRFTKGEVKVISIREKICFYASSVWSASHVTVSNDESKHCPWKKLLKFTHLYHNENKILK